MSANTNYIKYLKNYFQIKLESVLFGTQFALFHRIVIGFGLAILRDFIRDRLESMEDVGQALEVLVLVSIPELKKIN